MGVCSQGPRPPSPHPPTPPHPTNHYKAGDGGMVVGRMLESLLLPSVCVPKALPRRYLLNCSTFCNQTWYAFASSWARVSCEKVGLPSSRSRSQWVRAYVCKYNQNKAVSVTTTFAYLIIQCMYTCVYVYVSVRNGDFFDSGIMDQLRQQLWELTEQTQVDLSGSSHCITFQGTVRPFFSSTPPPPSPCLRNRKEITSTMSRPLSNE